MQKWKLNLTQSDLVFDPKSSRNGSTFRKTPQRIYCIYIQRERVCSCHTSSIPFLQIMEQATTRFDLKIKYYDCMVNKVLLLKQTTNFCLKDHKITAILGKMNPQTHNFNIIYYFLSRGQQRQGKLSDLFNPVHILLFVKMEESISVWISSGIKPQN